MLINPCITIEEQNDLFCFCYSVYVGINIQINMVCCWISLGQPNWTYKCIVRGTIWHEVNFWYSLCNTKDVNQLLGLMFIFLTHLMIFINCGFLFTIYIIIKETLRNCKSSHTSKWTSLTPLNVIFLCLITCGTYASANIQLRRIIGVQVWGDLPMHSPQRRSLNFIVTIFKVYLLGNLFVGDFFGHLWKFPPCLSCLRKYM